MTTWGSREECRSIDLVFVHVSESVEERLRQQVMRSREADRVRERAVVFQKIIPVPNRAFMICAVVAPCRVTKRTRRPDRDEQNGTKNEPRRSERAGFLPFFGERGSESRDIDCDFLGRSNLQDRHRAENGKSNRRGKFCQEQSGQAERSEDQSRRCDPSK